MPYTTEKGLEYDPVPEENELHSRLSHHLSVRPGDISVVQVWRGYLAALLEWGKIDPAVHARLSRLLPEGEDRAILEVFLTPQYVAEHPELLEQVSSRSEPQAA